MSTDRRAVVVRPWSLDELSPGGGFGAEPEPFAPPAAPWGEAGGRMGTFGELPAPDAAHPTGWAERAEAERAEAVAAAMAEGYERGYAEGEQAARAQGESEVRAAAAVLHEAATGLRAHEARWSANLEENVAALAVLVARQLVQREVAADPALVRGLVAGALAQFPMDDQVTVRLHPEDLHRCRTLLGEEGVTLPDLRWVADPAVERGGCLLEGRERILDGRLDVALERAYRALGGVGA